MLLRSDMETAGTRHPRTGCLRWPVRPPSWIMPAPIRHATSGHRIGRRVLRAEYYPASSGVLTTRPAVPNDTCRLDRSSGEPDSLATVRGVRATYALILSRPPPTGAPSNCGTAPSACGFSRRAPCLPPLLAGPNPPACGAYVMRNSRRGIWLRLRLAERGLSGWGV
jgi:hypothetical protein